MKGFVLALLIKCFLIVSFVSPNEAYSQQIPPKVQVFLTVCGYGAVGGALLGFATMAFDSSSIAIAQGASLGLYTGILFGTYVLLTYQGESGFAPENGTYSFKKLNTSQNLAYQMQIERNTLRTSAYYQGQSSKSIPIYMNLVNYTF